MKKIIPVGIKERLKKVLKPNHVLKYTATKHYVLNVCEQNKRFQDKVAIVTGGSGAIGRAICLRLAFEGAIVFVAGRNEVNAEKVVLEIAEKGAKAYTLVMNVMDIDSIDSAVKSVLSKHEKIDILVNCAGGSSRNKAMYLHEQDVDVIDEVINSNLLGSMLCSKVVAQQMVLNKSGKIVNISSVIANRGKSKFTDYAAAKAGIIGYTASLALELGRYGINVNCVSPGFIQRGEFSEDTLKYLVSTNCLRTVGTLEDIANAVAFIASSEADFITGQNIIVDGGRSLGLMGD